MLGKIIKWYDSLDDYMYPGTFRKHRLQYEPRSEKTGLGGFRPGPSQTGLYSPRRLLDA